MQSAFGTVVLVVCGIGVLGAIVALLINRRTWDEYGRSHLMLDSDPDGPARAGGSSGAERDTEIRELLEARNARRRRRGEPELDVERELGRLRAPRIDPGLEEEIRELVIARNHRRARRGEPPLDVEAEIAREIAELDRI